MIVEIAAYAAGVCVLVGSLFSLLAVVGILRLPDIYSRMHSASKAGTVGSGLCLFAIAIASLDLAVTTRALAGMVFLVLTAPISAHLLARAAYLAGFRARLAMALDELAEGEVPKK